MEGADRLVADEVLKYDNESTLKVVLTLVLSDYIQDFAAKSPARILVAVLQRDLSVISKLAKSADRNKMENINQVFKEINASLQSCP